MCDSKTPHGPALAFDPDTWASLLHVRPYVNSRSRGRTRSRPCRSSGRLIAITSRELEGRCGGEFFLRQGCWC
ncbi:DUF397 domain-containing protein [Streptomyces mangrovi]|uniref:DUF397 domain-containing protein n=1 Tax=Streptomyces mangrovi TaxID=1206892 RepID=UPI00399D30BB